MKIVQDYIPTPSKRSSGQKLLGVRYITAHDSGNDGSTAQNNVDYYKRTANDTEASAQVFVDDKGVIECIDLGLKAWHVRYSAGIAPNIAGNFANDYSIGVELCYSTKGLFDSKLAYSNYVEYIRGLCKKYNLDPRKDIVGHYKLDPTRRTDPLNAFSKIGKTWDQFINEVAGPSAPPTSIKKDLLLKVEELKSLINKLT